MGRKENTVTGSHKWEFDGCGVAGHKPDRTGSVWLLLYGELNVCFRVFHQSAANIRVIQK